jgi:hypothetical protein
MFERLVDSAGARLQEAGFVVTEEKRSIAFGNRLIKFERGMLAVSAILEKGQAFLALSSPGLDGRWDIGLWEACADKTLPSLEPRDFRADLDWLLIRLPDLDALLEAGKPDLENCLRTNGEWRFKARHELGMIRPPED